MKKVFLLDNVFSYFAKCLISGCKMNAVYKALADPTRRRILDLLRGGDLCAGDISREFSMTDASISRHLTILRSAGLVESRKVGQQVIYSLDATVFAEILSWILTIKG